MKHSNINSADQLHYAKVRGFTGDPALVVPDFVDQLLVRRDTQEAYVSSGTNAGELFKLLGSAEPVVINTPAAILGTIMVQDGQVLTTDEHVIFED